MTTPPTWYRWQGEHLELAVKVLPRAPRDAFVGPEGAYYRVRIQAAPVDGKGNAALRRFIAESFGVPLARVSLLSGEQSRHKRLRVEHPQRLPLPIERP